jgi:hypothetical protein
VEASSCKDTCRATESLAVHPLTLTCAILMGCIAAVSFMHTNASVPGEFRGFPHPYFSGTYAGVSSPSYCAELCASSFDGFQFAADVLLFSAAAFFCILGGTALLMPKSKRRALWMTPPNC